MCVTSLGVALLDGNLAAVGRGEIDGRNRRGYVERDAVLFGEDGYGVGADFVGHVSVGGDAVGAYYDGSDFALLHHGSGHVVGDDGGGDAVFHQFPGGEARALQKGARLVGVDVNLLACFDGRADHAERGAVAGGGERSGIAVGEHAAAGRHERCAVASHGLIGGDVFGVHALGFFDELLLDLRDGANAEAFRISPSCGGSPRTG